MKYIGINLLDQIKDNPGDELKNHDRLKVYIDKKVYTLSEKNGKLEIRVDSDLVIYPSHCNNLQIKAN